MNPVRAHGILVDTQRGNKKLYRKVVDSLAPGIGKRVPVVMEMPKLERHAAFAQLLAQPAAEQLSFNILSQWLVQEHAPMLCAWLDALDIAHDENGCANTFPASPPGDKLQRAVEKLCADFDEDLVTIYLTTFHEIDDVQWEPLEKILAEDERLSITPAGGSPATERDKAVETPDKSDASQA